MRLQQYINENIEHFLNKMSSDIQKVIRKDCKKYLKLVKSTGPFFRGSIVNFNFGEILKKNVRQDRHPQGTSDINFKRLNKWLDKNGHVRRDKAVSATSDEGNSMDFGVSYLFFPIGNFNYTWIKAFDVNLDDNSTGWVQRNIDYFFDYDDEYYLKMSDKDKKKFPKWFTTNKGIKTAHNNGYEIWFDCKSYYLINW